jgi:hypothetical protein
MRINEVDFKPIGKKALEAFHAHIASGTEPSWSLEEVNHEVGVWTLQQWFR